MNDPYQIDPQPVSACPRCGVRMGPGSVVCVQCGFDRQSKVVRATTMGIDEHGEIPLVTPEPPIAPPPPPPRPSAAAPASSAALPAGQLPLFAPDGKIKPNTLFIVGGVIGLSAIVATAYYAPAGSGLWNTMGRMALTLYHLSLQTGAGLAAILVAAKLTQHRVGTMEAAASRMLILVSTVFLILSIPLPLGAIAGIVGVVLACAMYWLMALVLFRKSPDQVNVLGIAHLALFLVLGLGFELTKLVDTSRPASVPVQVVPAEPVGTPPASAPSTPPPAAAPTNLPTTPPAPR